MREFLKTQNYSISDIDLLYEKYRKECLYCYHREPKEPVYSNGKLKVYKVEGIFVAAILEETENRVIAPKGAEFTADRQVKWVKDLELPRISQTDGFSGKTMDDLRTELGVPHISLTLGETENVPCYMTSEGYLAGFLFSEDRVSGMEMIDLLRG